MTKQSPLIKSFTIILLSGVTKQSPLIKSFTIILLIGVTKQSPLIKSFTIILLIGVTKQSPLIGRIHNNVIGNAVRNLLIYITKKNTVICRKMTLLKLRQEYDRFHVTK